MAGPNRNGDLNAISGMAEMVGSGEVPAEEFAQRVQQQAANLQSTAEKVRDIERAVVHQQGRETVNLTEAIGAVLVEQRKQHPSAKISVTVNEENITVTTNQSTFSIVVEEAIENAVMHADTAEPEIEVVQPAF